MKKIAILTGAGVSAESGISTFRDFDGLWEKYRIEDVATPEGFLRNPKLVTEFYNQRRKELLGTKPNAAHELIAKLEQGYDVTVITQNIDNLHERAGSTKVIHLHGELTKVCSSRNPDNPHFIKELKPENYDVDYREKAGDGSPIRPYVVWFGEAVPNIEVAADIVSDADIFVIIGTSLQVYPAAGLIDYVRHNVPIYVIDPKDVSNGTRGHNVILIQDVATRGMKQLYNLLMKE